MCQIAIMIFATLLPSLVIALTPPDPVNRTQVMHKAYRMQIPFIENKGQVGSDEVSFYAKTFGGTLYVGKDGTLTYSFPSGDKGGVVIKEIITDNKITVKGLEPSPTKVNYFRGKDQSKWKTSIPSYNSLSLGEVYKGIALTLKAYGKNVEKLFTVLPSADPGSIKVTLQGAKSLQVNDQGELEVLTDHGPITFTKPVAYQEVDGKRIEVEVRYKIEGAGGSNQEPEASLHESSTSAPNVLPATSKLQLASYGFNIGDYNKSFPLIIDPLLASTFLGGSGVENSNSLTMDRRGNVYVTGWTESSDFPTTPGGYDENYSGGVYDYDVFVSKLDSSLSTLVASTYLGGSGSDSGNSITLDGRGNVYVTGSTALSSDFPTTAGAYDESFNGDFIGGDIFISKLDSSLSTLVASTFLGGSGYDSGNSITLDGSGNVYVTGATDSPDFPTTPGTYDESLNGVRDVFVSKLDSSLSTLVASTFLGGNGAGSSITLDGSGNVYVTGGAEPGFPTTPGAYDESINGLDDVFVSKLDSSLSTLLASTFLGGGGHDWGENGNSITLDGNGNVYVTGVAYSGFPTTPGAYDESHNSNYYCDGFVSKLDSSLSILIASTFLGGTDIDYGQSLTLDRRGNVYVTGATASPDYPTTPGAYDESINSYEDVFVSKLDSSLSTLLASTFLGGSGDNNYGQSLTLDRRGNVYVTGYAGSGFPTTAGAYDESSNGLYDVFVSKLDSSLLANPQGCLVQMIFGQDSKEVTILRNFRDGVLNKTSEGQELIKFYYQWSPVLVKAMKGDEEFKQEVKGMIDSVLPMIGKDTVAQ